MSISYIPQTEDIHLEGKNPLSIIGLSEDILNLGLNDFKLQELCLVVAKNLLKNVHFDTGNTDELSKSKAKLYSRVFEIIKDYRRFINCLDQFKRSKSGTKADDNYYKRLWRESSDRAKRFEEENSLLSSELSALKRAKGKLVDNMSLFVRSNANSGEFPIKINSGTDWAPIANLDASGYIATISISIKGDSGGIDDIPSELLPRFTEGLRIFKKIFGNDTSFKFNVLTYPNPKASRIGDSILGCVDCRGEEGMLIRDPNRYHRLIVWGFNEGEMLSKIQPFLFFPGIIVFQPKVKQKRVKTDNISVVRNKLSGQISPARQEGSIIQHLFLGFKSL